MRASIEEDARFEFCGLQDVRFLIARAENLLDGGPAEGLMRGEPCLELGQTTFEPGAIAHRKPVAPTLPGFDQLEVAVAIPIVVEHPQCAWPIEFVNCVPSPVPDRQVQPAIAVEITRSDARPPAGSAGESPLRGHLLKVSVVISIHAHRTPFQGQRKVGTTVSVQVGEGGAAYQAKGLERFAG